MQDLQTKSLWSQVSGECISGDMEGRTLTLWPSSQATFAEFKRQFPQGRLLSKPQGLKGSPYDDYYGSRSRLGIFGRLNNFDRLDGKDKVVGLRLGCKNMAVSVDYLARRGHAWIECDDKTVLVTYNRKHRAVAAFLINGATETVRDTHAIKDGRVISGDGSREWNAFTGEATDGKAERLALLPTISAYWFAWVSFFPDTELIK